MPPVIWGEIVDEQRDDKQDEGSDYHRTKDVLISEGMDLCWAKHGNECSGSRRWMQRAREKHEGKGASHRKACGDPKVITDQLEGRDSADGRNELTQDQTPRLCHRRLWCTK